MNQKCKGKTYYMYYVLAEKIREKGILQKEVAELIGTHPSYISRKINGVHSCNGNRAHFSLIEAIKIQEEFFPEMTVNELFKTRAYTL